MVFFKTKRKDKEICSSFLYILADFQSSQCVAILSNTKVYHVVKWPDFHAECFLHFEMSKYMCCASSPYCAQIPHLINQFGIGKHFVVTLYFIFHLCGYCVSTTKGLKALFHPLVTRKIAHEPAMYSCSQKMLSYPTLYRRKCNQRVE